MSRSTPFSICLQKQVSRGVSRDAAEAVCRGERPPFNPRPLPPVQEVGPASSVGPGWRSQGANIGTDAVVYPDAKMAAKAWAKASPTRDRGAWEEHARRLGVSPEGIEKGWQHVSKRDEDAALATLRIIDSMRPKTVPDKNALATFEKLQSYRTPEVHDPKALATLRTVLGERGNWSGSWAPMKNTLVIDPNSPDPQAPPKPKPFKDKQPRVTPEKPSATEGVYGMEAMGVKTTQAPQIGNARGQAQQIMNQDPGFPFRTASAQKVWDKAQELILLYPLKSPPEILGRAIQVTGVLSTDLTPEDDQLLKMAIDYAQNGAPKTNVRTGGTPGGPFASQGFGHTMGNRGGIGFGEMRESLDRLIEFMNASSYPGPEPGKVWDLNSTVPGHPASHLFRDQVRDKEAKKRAKKKADFRPQLRKLSLWLQQKAKQ